MTRVHSGGNPVRWVNRAAPMRRSSATLTSQGEETGEDDRALGLKEAGIIAQPGARAAKKHPLFY